MLVLPSQSEVFVVPREGATPWYAVSSSAGPSIRAQDDFEGYSDGVQVHGLNGGTGWAAAWVDHLIGISDQDDFEAYADLSAVNGLNGGNIGWAGPWVDRTNNTANLIKAQDDLESYSDTAAVNGLSGGSDWGAAWVDR